MVVGTKVGFRDPEEEHAGEGKTEGRGPRPRRKAGAIKEPAGPTMGIKHLRHEGVRSHARAGARRHRIRWLHKQRRWIWRWWIRRWRRWRRWMEVRRRWRIWRRWIRRWQQRVEVRRRWIRRRQRRRLRWWRKDHQGDHAQQRRRRRRWIRRRRIRRWRWWMETRRWRWRIRRRWIRRWQQWVEVRRWKWRNQRRWMEIWRWRRIRRRRRRRRWRLVVTLTVLTSEQSEIRSPIIRAYLGRKHRSSSIRKFNSPPGPFCPSIFIRPVSEDQKSKNRDVAGRTKKLPRISPNKSARGSVTAYNARTRYPLRYPSTKYRDIFWKQRTISSPRFRPFELAAVSSRRNDFLLDGEFSSRVPPSALRSSFAIRKIGERSIYERIVRRDISIPLPRTTFALLTTRLFHSRSLLRIGSIRARRPTGTTFTSL